jgi:hypothetical protein
MENTATEHCINKKSIFAYYENGLINELSGRPQKKNVFAGHEAISKINSIS